MKLRALLLEQRTIDGLSFAGGALLCVAFYAWLARDVDAAPPPEPCASVPYELGARAACHTVAP